MLFFINPAYMLNFLSILEIANQLSSSWGFGHSVWTLQTIFLVSFEISVNFGWFIAHKMQNVCSF